ncbi:hypothetical protein [Virgisporangium aurantiacum]|uniref:hypothetical protein n=1 Tax=Virgisporangium aurantiacum TaxID=175570 RepID=UPI001950ACE0|nr:hypothetical protein [Virgisporangium aurantiacum]
MTAGIAGAAWAISSTAASADTNTTVDAHVGIDFPVTSNGGESRGITADLGVDVTLGRPAERQARPPVAAIAVTAVVAPVSTSDGPAPTTVDATVTVSRSTVDATATVSRSTVDGGAAAEVEAVVLAEPAAAAVRAAVVLGPTGTGDDSGSGAGSGDTGTDPETETGDVGATGSGLDAVPDTDPLGVIGATTADGRAAIGGGALARTGAPAVGLVLLALLLMLAGAASYRAGARH